LIRRLSWSNVPHRGPAVLVRERDRDEAVLLHLRGEGHELVEGLRRLVAALLEHTRPVEDRPRVVVERHEVLLAVVAGGGGLDGLGHAVQVLPDVADVTDEALCGEELHAVAREPGEDVVGLALQVGVDVLLERVVVDCVGCDLDVGVVEAGDELRVGLLRHGVGLVGAEGQGARGDLGPAAGAAARPAGSARPAGGQEARRTEEPRPRQRASEQ
jgi:hypothetical protein